MLTSSYGWKAKQQVVPNNGLQPAPCLASLGEATAEPGRLGSAVMSNRQRSIARRWFSEWTPDPPVYGRATEWLMNLVEYKPERAWDFILTLVDNAPNEDALGWVAAGPLEDLLCEHGPTFIDRVEAIATNNARFKACLPKVWARIGWTPQPTVALGVWQAVHDSD